MFATDERYCKLNTKSICFIVIYVHTISQIFAQTLNNEQEFNPSVTARCERNAMHITVITSQPFHGLIHTRDFRKSPCLAYGNGSLNTTLSVNLLAKADDKNYCGIHKLKGSEERRVALAVRLHKTLELSDDKFFLITCAQSGFKNARNELSRASLKFLDNGQKITRLVHGNQYTLRAELSSPDEEYNLSVKSCFSFTANTTDVELIDSKGCPKLNIISPFTYNQTNYAEATIYSMFKFVETSKMHIQCDIILCRGACRTHCEDSSVFKGSNDQNNVSNEIELVASTTVYVIEPGQASASYIEECTEWRFPWLIALCICLAILLLTMLLVNIFLCSSLSCSCIKTEVVEKEPSEIEDYDPYKIDWSPNSHYGSRTSLNKNGYASGGGSTLNSHRSFSGNDSDHYAHMPHSRPHSRFSAHSSKSPPIESNSNLPQNHYRKY